MKVIASILLLFCGINFSSPLAISGQAGVRPQDYAVYSAALNRLYDDQEKTQLLVIANQTEEKLPLKSLFRLNKKYLLVSRENLNALLFNRDQEAFYKKYPNSFGYIVLEEIHYSENAMQATLEIGLECGVLCGVGWHLELSKKNEKWEVQKKEVTWQK